MLQNPYYFIAFFAAFVITTIIIIFTAYTRPKWLKFINLFTPLSLILSVITIVLVPDALNGYASYFFLGLFMISVPIAILIMSRKIKIVEADPKTTQYPPKP